MKSTLFGLFVVCILVVVGFLAVPIGYDDALVSNDVEEEPQTLSTEDWVELDHAEEAVRIEDDETVRDADDDEELAPGIDYEMNHSSGEIRALEQAYDDQDVLINYTWMSEDEDTETIGNLLAIAQPLVVYGVPIAALGLLLGWVARW